MRNVSFSFYLLLLLLVTACQDKKEILDGHDYQPERLQELLPLQPGKYLTYKLDSLVFTGLGLVKELHTYQEKNVVDAEITDASGRPSYRVYRYLRDEAGNEPWRSAGTYFITIADNRVEWVENNRRVVKMVLPVKEGVTWKGNQYLPSEPYSPEINNFSVGNALRTWDFVYEAETNETIGNFDLPGVRTVFHIDESTNLDADDELISETSYAARSYSVEKYAKDLGLVYQKLLLWEYQPEEPGSTANYKGRYKGFGVTRTLIDYN